MRNLTANKTVRAAAVLVGLCYLPVLRRAKKEAEAAS